jgi:hypothetical protein
MGRRLYLGDARHLAILYFYRANNYTIQQASAITSAQRGLSICAHCSGGVIRDSSAYPIVSIARTMWSLRRSRRGLGH